MLYKTEVQPPLQTTEQRCSRIDGQTSAAKMMVAMGNTQEEACGDGVTTAMMLCGALLEEANNLLAKDYTTDTS